MKKQLEFGDIKQFNFPISRHTIDTRAFIGVVVAADSYMAKIIGSFRDKNSEQQMSLNINRYHTDYNQVKLSPQKRKKLSKIANDYRKKQDAIEYSPNIFPDIIAEKLTEENLKLLFSKSFFNIENDCLNFYELPSKNAYILESKLPLDIIANVDLDFVKMNHEILEDLYISNKNSTQYMLFLKKIENKALDFKKIKSPELKIFNHLELKINNSKDYLNENLKYNEFVFSQKIIFKFKSKICYNGKELRLITDFLNKNLRKDD